MIIDQQKDYIPLPGKGNKEAPMENEMLQRIYLIYYI